MQLQAYVFISHWFSPIGLERQVVVFLRAVRCSRLNNHKATLLIDENQSHAKVENTWLLQGDVSVKVFLSLSQLNTQWYPFSRDDIVP